MQQLQKVEMVSIVQKELEKIPRWKLLIHLQNNEEKSVYQIAKDLGWSTGKTHGIVNNLLKTKTIKTRAVIQNGRAVKLVKLAK